MTNDSPIIGIDLGTTYCCVAALTSENHVEIIENQEGHRTTPSYVAFTEKGEIIGACAKGMVFRNPQNVIYDSKRLIGRKFDDRNLQENLNKWTFNIFSAQDKTPLIESSRNQTITSYKPQEISAKILGHLKNAAEQSLGKKITDAIITVPAYFNYHQRIATKEAGKLAGLNVLKLINEPTAAALAYIHKHKITDCKNMVVFDLGGGTFDVSILKVYGKSIVIKATSGNTHLGGRDFDNNLADFIMKEIKEQYGKDVKEKKIMPRIRAKSERIKNKLSIQHEAYLDFPNLFGQEDVDLKITRESFEKVNMHLFKRCVQTVENCLEDAKIDKSEVEKIILIGGAIRIPKLQQMLKEFFQGKELCKAINPDEAVAYGAAVRAAMFNKEDQMEVYQITEVAPLSLGTDILGDRMCWVIPRNTPIPIFKTQTYLTTSNQQSTMCCGIYEGERSLVKYNTQLGTTTLSLPPKPPGYPIDLTFEVDEDGILEVRTKTETGIYSSLSIEYNNDFEKANDMLQDARENMLSDNKKYDVITHWSKLKEYCEKMKAICCYNKRGIKDDEKKIILGVVEEILIWLDYNKVKNGSEAEKKHLISKQKEIYRICEPIVNGYGYKVKNMNLSEFYKLISQ